MKTALLVTLLTLVLVVVINFNESDARVVIYESQQQLKDETVTGIYEGYQNHTFNMLLNDGTRRTYPFLSDKSLLRSVSRTKLNTRVTITVKKGIVVRFEEATR